MAALSDLVTAISGVTGLPEATVFAYGRFAREAGFIQQKGRGSNAAAMSIADAANLLIAVAATGVTRDAGAAVQAFRTLKRGHLFNFAGVDPSAICSWLRPLGIKPAGREQVADFRLSSDFGRVFEYFIESTLDGSLAAVFQKIPVAEIPDELFAKWKLEHSDHLHESMEVLVENGFAKQKPSSELVFGEDISLEVRFSRLIPAVEIDFLRMWDNQQVVFSITFGPDLGAQSRAPHDLTLIAKMTQHALAAVALVVSSKAKASAVQSYKPIDALFSQQMQAGKHELTSNGGND